MSGTIPDDRAISEAESAIIEWVLLHGSRSGDLSSLSHSIPSLHVVGRCGCGCPSVDFEEHGQSGDARPIAEAAGSNSEGVSVGIILWGLAGRISGIEFYANEAPVRSLPTLDSLYVWPPEPAFPADGAPETLDSEARRR